jgi:pimeloyl-ACP methyl ester carboxylesterase
MIHRMLNSLILLPDRYCYQAPADLGLWAEEATFPNAQGQPLKGFFCKQGPPGPDHNETPTVLFCPGTSGNLSSHLHYIELLCRAGLAVLGFDYTGFGQSAGTASLHSLVTDALGAGDFLQRAKKVERFGIFGVSIGANVALMAATLRSEAIRGVAVEGLALQRDMVRGILTEGSMGPRSIATITYNGRLQPPRAAHVLNPIRIGGWLAEAFSWVGATFFPFQAKDPHRHASALEDVPVFFIHGVEDPLLPCEATLQVYETKPGAKRLWLIPGVGHTQEPALAQDAEYAAQLGNFFHDVLCSSPPSTSHMPPMTCEVIARRSGTFALRVYNPGPPGLALTTMIDNKAVDFQTVWVHDWVDVPCIAGSERCLASCLRLFEVSGCGAAAQVRLTARGRRYQEVFQAHIRALSKTLHEGRLPDLDALLHAMPEARPEAPFDFFLGLYCVQIMRRTQHKLPHLARAAAAVFTRYWHYGTPDHYTQPTPWELASAILGKHVGPSQAVPGRDP